MSTDMTFSFEKIIVQARKRALNANWTFEYRNEPPKKHNGFVDDRLQNHVVLKWDRDESIRNSANEIREWLAERFGSDDYCYIGLLCKDRTGDEMCWRFQFAHPHDAIQFKLRWG